MRQGQATASSVSITAPIGGWNTIDPIANMPTQDAVYLDNFFPRTADVMLRRGYVAWSTVEHNAVKLLGYESPAGLAKLFVTAPGGIYESAKGSLADTLSSAYTSTNHDWYSVNITTAGGSFLWACNGTDAARYYDGAAWTVLSNTGTGGSLFTGMAPESVTHVNLFKSRLTLCQKDSLSFWYLDVNSIAGAAVEYPMGSLFRHGGYLVATTSWTVDAGNGSDDYFVAITSKGECAVFQGINPSDATQWSLVGIYMLASPLGRECFVKLGGDVGVLTVQGLMPLSKALLTSTIDRTSNLTRKVDRALLDAAELYKGLRGWQPILYSEASILLVNVPGYNEYAEQYVMNTMTGAWCRFKGMEATSWLVFNGELLFIKAGQVFQAWQGADDNGSSIEARAKTAFSYLGRRGSTKKVTMIRPIFNLDQNVAFQMYLDVDYSDDNMQYTLGTSVIQQIALWDDAIWDQAVWLDPTTQARWRSISQKPGRAVAVNLRVNPKGVSMSWSVTDMLLLQGGLM